MKFLALALILTFFGGSFAGAQTIEPEVREKVLGAYHEAIEVLNEYSKNPRYKPQYRETTRLMAELLDKADFGSPSAEFMKRCIKDPKLEAATDPQNQVIAFCPYGLSLDKNKLTQTFIHEAYHLYEGKYYYRIYYPDLYRKFLANGFDKSSSQKRDSEKRATIMELEIMLKTYGCVYSTSGYFRPLLGLVENRDYTICK